MINELKKNKLIWLPEIGIGFYPVKETPYDVAYFNKYAEMAKTEIGVSLNVARVNLVNKYTNDEVIDVGIGCGTFIESRENTKGFDVNPAGIKWLHKNKKYKDPYYGCNHATFWDSLEHIENPELLLEKISGYVFVSIPIFISHADVLLSKHYRKDEHFWYFTDKGFKYFMDINGFDFIESNKMETLLGRESIGTYVFRKRDDIRA